MTADLGVVYTTMRAGWNATSAAYQGILVKYLLLNISFFFFHSLVKLYDLAELIYIFTVIKKTYLIKGY